MNWHYRPPFIPAEIRVVRLLCHQCAWQDVPVDRVSLVMVDSGYAVAFNCPTCGETPGYPITHKNARLIRSYGVKLTMLGPITEEEIVEFVDKLDTVRLSDTASWRRKRR